MMKARTTEAKRKFDRETKRRRVRELEAPGVTARKKARRFIRRLPDRLKTGGLESSPVAASLWDARVSAPRLGLAMHPLTSPTGRRLQLRAFPSFPNSVWEC